MIYIQPYIQSSLGIVNKKTAELRLIQIVTTSIFARRNYLQNFRKKKS